jgi:hypothetical protein
MTEQITVEDIVDAEREALELWFEEIETLDHRLGDVSYDMKYGNEYDLPNSIEHTSRRSRPV